MTLIHKIKNTNFKTHFYLTLVFFIPFFILFFFSFFLIPNKPDIIKEIIAFGMQTFIYWLTYFLIGNKKLKSYFIITSNLILSLLLLIKLGFYYNFKAKLSSSVLYIIYETNKTESFEFLTNYLDLNLIILSVFVLLFSIYFFKIFIFNKDKNELVTNILSIKINHTINKLVALSVILLTGFLIQKKLSDENLIIKSYTSYKEYKEYKKGFKEVLALKTNNNIKVTAYNKEPQTFVIIVGESISNWHMQLYNYNRKTNPLLSEIKNELLIFKNIKTPNVHTIHAIEKIFTLVNKKNRPNKANNTSIIQLANQAGFTTYWVSNQRPIGMNESIPSLIGSAATNKYFLNTEDFGSIAYDEILLPTLDSILKDNNKKRIIFLHLMGSHIKYNNRYPKKFNFFNKKNNTAKFTHPKAIKTINEYDNTVRYNDSIVRTIIEKVRAKNLNSFVLYFSDHGDEVYDTLDWYGHSSGINSKPMFDVPFLLWTSSTFKKQKSFISTISIDREYNLEHFIHSFANLTKIKFEGYNKELSVFNNSTDNE